MTAVPFLIGALVLAVAIVVLLVLYALEWIPSSQPDSCMSEGGCYCEDPTPRGRVAQPVNTLSNLGFVAVGLLILLSLPKAVAGSHVDPMEEASSYAVIYGCVVVFLGPGSMYFHASLKRWGGWLDNLSMILYTGFLFAYDLAGIAGWGVGACVAIWLIVGLIGGLLAWFVRGHYLGQSVGTLCFATLAIVWGGLQVLALTGLGEIKRDLGDGLVLLAAGATCFFVAFAIQQRSQTGKPWCQPQSRFQGHALWHLLTAVTTAIVFFYLQTEVGPRAG
jgi:Ceramidase